jgi:phage/plasmid-associated DNA primase
MRNTFGEYVSSLSTTALTRKRPDSGSANPDIINIKNKRFICMQEPDEREQLNTARMKQFSGEDIVEARGLFKDQDQFKITGKFFMSCNRLPPIHSMDDGTWRRIRVIPFKSRFVTASDPSINPENNVYPRDPFLDDKLKRWRVTFLGLMVHYYKTKYMKDGIKSVPKEVKKFSDEYKQSYDSFAKFRDARVRDVSTAKAERRAGLMEHNCIFKNIRSTYRSWAQDSSVGSKVLSENELRIRCHDAFGTPADGKTFKGVRLFNSDEEVEAFDAGIEE